MSQTQRDRPPVRPVSNRQRQSANTGRPAAPPRRSQYAYEQPRRDPFPYVMGGLMGAIIVGLGLVIVFLLINRPGGTVNVPAGTTNQNDTGTTGQGTTAPQAEAQRISLEEFKALYDDPAKRPIVLDVRTKEVFDQGHIKDAKSFPEAEVDKRVGELPKDKLIVAYCQ